MNKRSNAKRFLYTQIRRVTALALALTVAAPGTSLGAGGGDHVRVVLDVSKSMSKRLRDGSGPNDPGRLAVLATMLLYDLVDPNPRDPLAPDSFEVLPFKPDWEHWTDPAADPPTGTGAPITAIAQDLVDRSVFWKRLKSLPYDGDWTYFYPGLAAALASLEDSGSNPADRKLIVLVTDGLPEPEVREREAKLLMALRARLLAKGVRLYVLAFGGVADRERGFFEQVFSGAGGDELGALFVDPSGRDLVLNMARIFSRGFGYEVEHLGPGGTARDVDLDGGVTPPKVSVVALARGKGGPPVVRIEPPVNAVRGWVQADERGAAYALTTIEGLARGAHRLFADVDGADVAVLRRIQPELAVLPGHVERNGREEPMGQAQRAIADTPFVLRVLAASPTGASGGQADIAIGFRQHGPRKQGCTYAWTKDLMSAVPGSRTSFGRGVTYDIRLEYPTNAAAPGSPYSAFVEVISKYQGQVVGQLDCERAHPLIVYPKITIKPSPAGGFLTPNALGEGETGRIGFRLVMDDPARLDVIASNSYRVRAEIEALQPGLESGPLAGAVMHLDGDGGDYRIAWQGHDSPWLRGRELTREQLLGTHELTLQVGAPPIDLPTEDLPLRLHLTLLHPPYDEFGAISPFEAKLKVIPVMAPPVGLPTEALRALGLALLSLLVALLIFARRYPLPKDLAYRLAPITDDHRSMPGRALRAHPWTRLALPEPRAWVTSPIRPPRPIEDPDSGAPLCWVKPLERQLYGLRLAPGTSLEEADGTQVVVRRRIAKILAHQVYHLRGSKGHWLLQLGYRRPEQAGRTNRVWQTETHKIR